MEAWYRELPQRVLELNELFNACFRIQAQASEAAGRHIPLIVENVKGAQPWVGRAQANFGSYYLWGDIGMVGKRVVALLPGRVPRFEDSVTAKKANKVPGFRFDGNGGSFQTASVEAQKVNPDGTGHPPGSWFAVADSKNRGTKSKGQNWSRFAETGEVSPHWRLEAAKSNPGTHERTSGLGRPRFIKEEIKNEGGSWFNIAHNTESGVGNNPVHEHVRIEESGIKLKSPGHYLKPGSGPDWYDGGAALFGSKSAKRKMASAMIAKIPFSLARHIAKCFRTPQEQKT